MAWTTLDFVFASKLTSLKMTQMQSNFTALADGVAGAPPIKNAGRDFASATLTAGSESLGGGTWVVPAGLYILGLANDNANDDYVVQINSGGWRDVSTQNAGMMVYSDGSNVRVQETGATGAGIIYWLKIT